MPKEVILKAVDVDLFNKASKVGLGGGMLLQLLIEFGPRIVKILLDLLEKKQPQMVDGVEVSSGWLDDVFSVRYLLANLLKEYKDEIMSFLDDVENKVLDKIIEKLGG